MHFCCPIVMFCALLIAVNRHPWIIQYCSQEVNYENISNILPISGLVSYINKMQSLVLFLFNWHGIFKTKRMWSSQNNENKILVIFGTKTAKFCLLLSIKWKISQNLQNDNFLSSIKFHESSKKPFLSNLRLSCEGKVSFSK